MTEYFVLVSIGLRKSKSQNRDISEYKWTKSLR